MAQTLRMESSVDVIDLNEQWGSGVGYQAHAGALGLGMPDADVQWFEGAGSGSVYRGRRVQGRDIDLPMSILTTGKADLEARLDRLTTLLSSPFRLVRVNDAGERWVIEAVHVGGGDYLTGTDTNGETEWYATLQLRSGWPTWRRDTPDFMALSPEPTGDEFPYGVVQLSNDGAANAWPVYTVQGPGSFFEVRDADGYGFRWAGALATGETLRIDTENGTVVDGTGANRYGLLEPAPRMMPLKPGLNSVTVTMEDKATGPGGAAIVKASTTPNRVNHYPKPRTLASAGAVDWVRRNMCLNPAATTSSGWQARAHSTGTVVELQNVAAGTSSTPTTPNRGATGRYNRAVVTKASSGPNNFSLFSPPNLHGGANITASGWVRPRGNITQVRPVMRLTNSDDIGDLAVPDVIGDPVDVPFGEFVRVHQTVEAPAGSRMWFGVRVEGGVVGDWVDMTEVLYEYGSELRPYFDGEVGSTAGLPGVTRKWASTADGLSIMEAPTATGWTLSSNYVRAWVASGVDGVHVISSPEGGYVTGLTVAHAAGTPWVGSVRTARVSGDSVKAQFLLVSATGKVAAKSSWISTTTTAQRATASGGGVLVTASGTMAPRMLIQGAGVTKFDQALMEASTNLGGYFTGSDTATINGVYEWAGTVENSASNQFPAKWERASLTTIEYNPRRWMVI